MLTLIQLIEGARAAASPTPTWIMEGGRRCPLGWWDCSQPVFRDAGSDAWDYGEPGGPGWADCEENCRHAMQPAPIDEEDDDA